MVNIEHQSRYVPEEDPWYPPTSDPSGRRNEAINGCVNYLATVFFGGLGIFMLICVWKFVGIWALLGVLAAAGLGYLLWKKWPVVGGDTR